MQKLFHKILYKKQAHKVMLAMENCDAYKDFQSSSNMYNEKIESALKHIINDVEYCKGEAIENGEFCCHVEISKKLKSEHRRYLKKYFLNKGYKIKFESSEMLFSVDTLIISWKHWR